MGRSRAVPLSNDDDPTQRLKRKRAPSSVETIESATEGLCTSDGKRALYHCNYCNKDISGRIRIKCAACSDFDLCIECFSVGAKVDPHESDHPYRVMDNLSFPFICRDWNADEEILLLEGIGMYGFGNWVEIAEHVGTQSKSECINHYNTIYKNSPCFPRPDLSHLAGKNREEVVAMWKEHSGLPKALGDVALKEESPSPSPAKVKVEEPQKEPEGRRLSGAEVVGSGLSSTTGGVAATFIAAVPKNAVDNIKVEDSHSHPDRSVGEKKPRDERAAVSDLSGYNPKRQEFEVEYDNDAEQLLSDMDFKDTDTEAERELKLRVLRIYGRRLDERKRRKDFVLERNLLYPDPFEKSLSPEEKDICQKYRVFMRFHSNEEHKELLTSIIEEHRILKRIQDLQEARAAGCRTSAEAERFIDQKRKREAETNAQKANESVGGKVLARMGHHRELANKDSSSTNVGPVSRSSLDDWDITGFPGAELLTDTEKRLCEEIRILPSHYLNMLQIMSMEVMKGTISKKSDAHNLFKVDSSKIDRIYDMLVKKGIVQQ